MTLALRLGKTLAELDSQLTARELYLWMAYDKISPIGDRRYDIHAAQIASAVYQSRGVKASMADMVLDWRPDDAVGYGDEPAKELDEKTLDAIFNSMEL
jgi:hypothetical protein